MHIVLIFLEGLLFLALATVFGGGVDRMSADGFSHEMSEYDEDARLDDTPKVAPKRTVADRISPDALAKLKALRDGK